MIFVDDGAEKLVLDGEFDIAIPFSVAREADGEPKITVFPSQKRSPTSFCAATARAANYSHPKRSRGQRSNSSRILIKSASLRQTTATRIF